MLSGAKPATDPDGTGLGGACTCSLPCRARDVRGPRQASSAVSNRDLNTYRDTRTCISAVVQSFPPTLPNAFQPDLSDRCLLYALL